MGKVTSLFLNSAREQPHAADDFAWFWDAYPRKKKKLDAERAWRQTADLRPPIEALIAALDKQVAEYDWVGRGESYFPYPATWLRAGQWADE